MKIEQINGFSIGNVVRLKDGDGRPHTIRSFTLDGIRITNWFCVVHFEDGTETMLDNIEIFQQPSLPEGLEYYNKIIDELENRSRMSAPEATKAAKWMKEFYHSPSIYPSGNVGIAENSAKPQEPQGLVKTAKVSPGMLSNFGDSSMILDVTLTQEEMARMALNPLGCGQVKIKILCE